MNFQYVSSAACQAPNFPPLGVIRMRLKIVSGFLLVLLVSALVRCGGGSNSNPPNVKLTAIAVTPSNSTIAFGTSQQFKAMGSYSDGSLKDITSSVVWSTSASNIATVKGTGLATPVKGGQVTITATSGNVHGSTALTITTSLTSISISPNAPNLNVGNNTQLTAMGTYSDSTTQDITSSVSWSSSDSTVASISAVRNGVRNKRWTSNHHGRLRFSQQNNAGERNRATHFDLVVTKLAERIRRSNSAVHCNRKL